MLYNAKHGVINLKRDTTLHGSTALTFMRSSCKQLRRHARGGDPSVVCYLFCCVCPFVGWERPACRSRRSVQASTLMEGLPHFVAALPCGCCGQMTTHLAAGTSGRRHHSAAAAPSGGLRKRASPSEPDSIMPQPWRQDEVATYTLPPPHQAQTPSRGLPAQIDVWRWSTV